MQYSEESLGQVKLKQLLYDGGKTRYSGRAASKAADAQRDSAEATRLDTVYVVSQAYYRVLEARELLQVGENSRSQREAFFKLTDSYFRRRERPLGSKRSRQRPSFLMPREALSRRVKPCGSVN